MNKHQTGIQIARGLRTSEHALDEALAQTMRLGADMLDGRKTSHLAASVGHAALQDVITGLQAMTAARTAIIAAHSGLLQVAEEHAVIWKMDGATETKPDRPKALLPTIAANAA
ncbi:MAG: hypothetical protein P0Y52_08840 [Candidatus Brevundimonas phytovorans]|nr:hypothetical protein [Brevundimonas sp.]WEK56657.1 MAG: hypothetical protein P0Y52_08840 [Brevundimonas sp.]